jgi:hypothetical protein
MVAIPDTMEGLVLEKYATNAEEEKTPYTLRKDLAIPKIEPFQILLRIVSAGECNVGQRVAPAMDTALTDMDNRVLPHGSDGRKRRIQRHEDAERPLGSVS